MATPETKFQPGQMVRVNLAGHAGGGRAVPRGGHRRRGHVIRQTSEQPPMFLVKLLFSFKGVNEVEVPADRVRAA